VIDLFEQLEVVFRHGDAVVVLDGRIGQVGRVARLAVEQPVVGLLVAFFVFAEDDEQLFSLRLERLPELLALSRCERSLGMLGVHATCESNSDARDASRVLAAAVGTQHAPVGGMTKAEEFKTLAEHTGRPKRRSVRKPKKSAWSHAKRHAETKATHALEVTTSGRPSRKSTRASANRAKPDAPMELTNEYQKVAPRAVARQAQVERERVRGKGR
jgi:hypothetical protein